MRHCLGRISRPEPRQPRCLRVRFRLHRHFHLHPGRFLPQLADRGRARLERRRGGPRQAHHSGCLVHRDWWPCRRRSRLSIGRRGPQGGRIVSAGYATELAIAGMAIATYATRVSGLCLVRFMKVEGRTKAALDAVPPAILMAVIAPVAFATGPAETAAAVVTAIAALRLPLILAVI